jgi:hypothetical protein
MFVRAAHRAAQHIARYIRTPADDERRERDRAIMAAEVAFPKVSIARPSNLTDLLAKSSLFVLAFDGWVS